MRKWKKKQLLAKWVKYLLDFMFYCGIVATAALPFSFKWIENNYEP